MCRLLLAIMYKHDVIHEPEIYNIANRQRRTGDVRNMHKNFGEARTWRYACGQTDRQTRLSQYSAPLGDAVSAEK